MNTKQKVANLACIPVLVISLLAGCGQKDAPPTAPVVGLPMEPATSASRDFGDYVLHYNALRTDTLTPEIAKTYNIARSSNRALVNISLIKKAEDGPGQPVAGKVTAQAVNLNGQFKDLILREIREGDAMYYIGDVPVANDETLVFTVDAIPANETRPLSVRFQREFVGN